MPILCHFCSLIFLPSGIDRSGAGLSAVGSRTQFTFWVITASPLLLGNDLRHMSPQTLATVSNPEVIAVNQDPLALRGELVYFWLGLGVVRFSVHSFVPPCSIILLMSLRIAYPGY